MMKTMIPDMMHPMNEATFWRGAFIGRWGAVEYAVFKLLLRAWAHDDYKDLGQPPFSWKSKLNRLKIIIEQDGSLRPYAEPLRAALNPLLAAEDRRHIIAHGLMGLSTAKESPRSLIFLSHRFEGGNVGPFTLEITIDELCEMVTGMIPLVDALTGLCDRIFVEANLPEVGEEDRRIHDPEPRSI